MAVCELFRVKHQVWGHLRMRNRVTVLWSQSERLSCLCSSLNWSPELEGKTPDTITESSELFHCWLSQCYIFFDTELLFSARVCRMDETLEICVRSSLEPWLTDFLTASYWSFDKILSSDWWHRLLIGKGSRTAPSDWPGWHLTRREGGRNETGTFPFSPFLLQSVSCLGTANQNTGLLLLTNQRPGNSAERRGGGDGLL